MFGMAGWSRQPPQIGVSANDVCEFSTCQTRTTIRWKGRVGIPTQQGREVIQTQKWICMDDVRLLNQALAQGLPINLTPDGWIYVDNVNLIAFGL